jgi:hypothetical protein
VCELPYFPKAARKLQHILAHLHHLQVAQVHLAALLGTMFALMLRSHRTHNYSSAQPASCCVGKSLRCAAHRIAFDVWGLQMMRLNLDFLNLV